MAIKASFKPIVPINYIVFKPQRVVQYPVYEGLPRRKARLQPLLPEFYKKILEHQAAKQVDEYGFGFLPPLEYYQYPDGTKQEIIDEYRAGIDAANEAREKHNNSLQNLLNNKAITISHAARKRIIDAVGYLFILSKRKYYDVVSKFEATKDKVIKRVFVLNFVTFTLCSKQFHSDKYVKAEMWDTLLQYLRDKYKMRSYVWRCERQGNGNIHFHLITNVFLPAQDIRKHWNKIQKRHGYIDAYIDTGGNDNPNGFHVKPVNSPNAAAAYCAKYIAKTEKKAGEDIEKGVQSLKPIEGRQWYLSSNLSAIEPIRDECMYASDVQVEIDALVASKGRKWCTNTEGYATWAYVDMFSSDLKNYPTLLKYRKDFIDKYSHLIA